MKQVNCPINFKTITKEYNTRDLTVVYREKKKPGFNGVCYHTPNMKRRKFGAWYEQPLITLTIGQNAYPYKTKDRFKVEFVAQTKEELTLFLFWHEFQHYLDAKASIKTKHREISEIAYNRVWGGK